MALLEVKENEVIVSLEQLQELTAQRDEAILAHNRKAEELVKEQKVCQSQKVLINHCAMVVNKMNKIFPGLASGTFMQGFNPMTLLSNPDLKKMGPDLQKIQELLTEYGKTNPIIIP